MSNNDFEKDKDMQEWEEFFSDIFEEESQGEDDLVSRFDREMKKTLAAAATEIEVKELEKKEDRSAELFWYEECQKALKQAKEKDIQIVDLIKEKNELYSKTKNNDLNGAVLAFISCVLGLILPLAALGIIQANDMLSSASNPLLIGALLLLVMVIAGGTILWFFVPICGLLVSAFNLEKAYREEKILKIFLTAALAVILLSLLVIFVL